MAKAVSFFTVIVLLASLVQSPVGARQLHAQALAVDTASLANGPYSTMQTLLEKTIFQVDVLTIQMRFGPEASKRLESVADGRPYSSELADSVATIALEAQDVWAVLRFKRDVSLNQFLGSVRGNLKRAWEAGIIDAATLDNVSQSLPGWYDFLAERGILKADEMMYRIRGDTLRTMYRAVTGEILLDQIDIGPERRLSVLGSYFAPKSEFRKGLTKSLFETN